MTMAEENGNVSDLTIEILKGIRTELQGLRGDVGGLKTEMTAVKLEVAGLKVGLTEVRDGLTEVRAGLTEVRQDLADIRGEVAGVRAGLHELADYTQAGFAALLAQGDRRFLDHEGRLRRLEVHAGFEPPR
jgi:archaellum component FlaC